ncbi:hypothetical protein DFJ77DRAFT_541713 [Powellomyces hirtus]|nr:hypothetical protein DFJ77DRAFT_541713 [Powellomyces hirtus]
MVVGTAALQATALVAKVPTVDDRQAVTFTLPSSSLDSYKSTTVRHKPVYICLDISGSMAGSPLAHPSFGSRNDGARPRRHYHSRASQERHSMSIWIASKLPTAPRSMRFSVDLRPRSPHASWRALPWCFLPTGRMGEVGTGSSLYQAAFELVQRGAAGGEDAKRVPTAVPDCIEGTFQYAKAHRPFLKRWNSWKTSWSWLVTWSAMLRDIPDNGAETGGLDKLAMTVQLYRQLANGGRHHPFPQDYFLAAQRPRQPCLCEQLKAETLTSALAILNRLSTALEALTPQCFKFTKADLSRMLEKCMEVTALTDALYARIAHAKRTGLTNAQIAEWKDLASRPHFSNRRANKELDKRAINNADTILSIPDQVLANCDCLFSLKSVVETLTDQDCIEYTILDPTQLVIDHVGPSFMTAVTFFETIAVAKRYAHAGENVNAVIPLWLSDEHWKVVKIKVKMVVGYTCTLDVLGYTGSQYTTVPFMAWIRSVLQCTSDNEHLLFIRDRLFETCVAIYRPRTELRTKTVERFHKYIESASARTIDEISHTGVFLAPNYLILDEEKHVWQQVARWQESIAERDLSVDKTEDTCNRALHPRSGAFRTPFEDATSFIEDVRRTTDAQAESLLHVLHSILPAPITSKLVKTMDEWYAKFTKPTVLAILLQCGGQCQKSDRREAIESGRFDGFVTMNNADAQAIATLQKQLFLFVDSARKQRVVEHLTRISNKRGNRAAADFCHFTDPQAAAGILLEECAYLGRPAFPTFVSVFQTTDYTFAMSHNPVKLKMFLTATYNGVKLRKDINGSPWEPSKMNLFRMWRTFGNLITDEERKEIIGGKNVLFERVEEESGGGCV